MIRSTGANTGYRSAIQPKFPGNSCLRPPFREFSPNNSREYSIYAIGRAFFGYPIVTSLPHRPLRSCRGIPHQITGPGLRSVPKLYPTRASVAILAILAVREMSKLHGFRRATEFESHPLRHLLYVRSEEILYRAFRRHSLGGLNRSAKHLG